MGVGKNYLGDAYANFGSGNAGNSGGDIYATPTTPKNTEPFSDRVRNFLSNSFRNWQADAGRQYLQSNGQAFTNPDPEGALAMTGKKEDTSLSQDSANNLAKNIMDLDKETAAVQKERDKKYYGGDKGAYEDILSSENLSELDKAKGQVGTNKAQANADEIFGNESFGYDSDSYSDAIRKEWNGQRGIIPSTESMYDEWVASTYEPGTFGYSNWWDFSGPESNAQDWYDFVRWADENYGAYSDARDYLDSAENFEQNWFNPTKAKNNIFDYFENGANADMFGTSYADIENAAANIANLGLPLFSADGNMAIAPEDPGYLDALTAQMALAAMGYGAQNPYSISQTDWNKLSDAFTRVGASDVDYAGFDNNKYTYDSNAGLAAEDLADLYGTNWMDYGLWASNPEMLTYYANMLGQQAGYGNTYQVPEGMTSEDILNATFSNRSSRNKEDKGE